MRPCPVCSEQIQDNAKKCKHCGEWLDVGKLTASGSKLSSVANDLISGGIALIVLGLLLCFIMNVGK